MLSASAQQRKRPAGPLADAVDLFAVAGGEPDAPTFFVFSDILYYPGVFVNGFFQNFFTYFLRRR